MSQCGKSAVCADCRHFMLIPSSTAHVASVLLLLFLCSAVVEPAVTIQNPYSLRRQLQSALANFGAPPVTTRRISSDIVIAEPIHGCTPPSSLLEKQMQGRIVLVERGSCSFTAKSLIAQAAGAIGVLVANAANTVDNLGDVFTMADDGHGAGVHIPVEMINAVDAALIIRAVREYSEEVQVAMGHQVPTALFMT